MDGRTAVGLLGSVAGATGLIRLGLEAGQAVYSAVAFGSAGILVIVGAGLMARVLEEELREDEGASRRTAVEAD